MSLDPVDLTARLVRCASVTPEEGGALVLLAQELEQAGFSTTRIDRGGVCNLFARWGDQGANGPVLGFNGHTDVVPVGDVADWTFDPFSATIKDGFMYGRGTTDMKSGVAAFVAAAVDFVRDTPPDGSIIITITGDEEGPAKHGTVAILEWMAEHNQQMDHCLVGEPTCPETMGEMMKIGRRGSMTAYFTARGVQGHAAYPHRANNPVPAMAQLVGALSGHVLDDGTDHFDPSTLVVTTFDTGNPANNVIPAQCKTTVNIRFNDAHTADDLTTWLRRQADAVAADTGVVFDMDVSVSGESFVTPPGKLSDMVAQAVSAETGVVPEMSTSGGTSDARFVKHHCEVVEFGLVGKSMHQVDERVKVEQIGQLKAIYARFIRDYFGG
ncbi:succinyl-diaminopimelate desuccinylase [Amylibacter marinus]|uniref:Succinyl-diaminopimelate desuccinylase n=1 Tax=Amylibacter marinus TaxID=1475483 RepID=A0ABQ5VWN2_9RHOB|nr:succinyl-diaminopimelate desuccinylase [Amylibacter marinus]GLQ35707.1 succinyl-diaminopimelate desuccinylase [Amylibacter marinus]